jgi:hypothetical protein
VAQLDRRKQRRLLLALPVWIRPLQGEMPPFAARTIDISATGFLFESPVDLDVGLRLEGRLELPSIAPGMPSGIVHFRGSVVRQAPSNGSGTAGIAIAIERYALRVGDQIVKDRSTVELEGIGGDDEQEDGHLSVGPEFLV